MANKKNLYIATSFIFLLGLLGSMISLKISLGLIALLVIVLIVFEEPSRLLYVVILYAFFDYLFRKIGFLEAFSSIWDEALFVLIVFFYIIKSIWKNQLKVRISPLDIYMIVFLSVCIFLLFKVSPDMRIAIEGFRVYAEYALWFFVGLNLLKNSQQFKKLTSIYIFMIFLISVYGIYQYIIGVEIPSSWIDSAYETYIRTRVYSIIGSPNVLGSFLAMSIPIVLPLALNERILVKRIYYWTVVICSILALGFTFSRGAWLAFLLSMLIYAFFIDKRVFVMIFAIILSIPILAPSIMNRILYTLSPQYAQSSAKGGRIVRWIKAFELFKENFLFGVGFGRFGGAVAKRNIADAFYVDNFYLKSAVEMGAIGLIVMIITFAAGIVFAARVIKYLKSKELKMISTGFLIGLITVLIHNLFENIFEVPMMTTYFWLFLGFIFALQYIEQDENILTNGGS